MQHESEEKIKRNQLISNEGTVKIKSDYMFQLFITTITKKIVYFFAYFITLIFRSDHFLSLFSLVPLFVIKVFN